MADHSVDHIKQMTLNFSEDELTKLRQHIDTRLTDMKQGEQPGTNGPDSSADSEKKKYIAQHGSNPNNQETAQSVPEPESDEVKDLQNERARQEHYDKELQDH